MKIEKSKIINPLSIVCGVVPNKNSLPVLANILIESGNGKMVFTGQDDNVIISSWIESDEDLNVTIPAKKLSDIIKALDDSSVVSLDDKDDHVLVKSNKSRYKLSTLSVNEYPDVSHFSAVHSFDIECSSLCNLINKTSYAMAINDVRYYLNGLFFDIKNKTIRTVATDGHRMSVCEKNIDSDIECNFIIHAKSINEISKILSRYDDETCTVSISEWSIKFETGNLSIIAKKIDGKFPDYARVIPDVNKSAIFDRKELISALKRVAILSNEKYKSVLMKFNGDSVDFHSRNSANEEAEDSIGIIDGFVHIEFGCNALYFIDALSVIDSDNVELSFTDDNNKPSIVRGEGSYYGVVMPMRI